MVKMRSKVYELSDFSGRGNIAGLLHIVVQSRYKVSHDFWKSMYFVRFFKMEYGSLYAESYTSQILELNFAKKQIFIVFRK